MSILNIDDDIIKFKLKSASLLNSNVNVLNKSIQHNLKESESYFLSFRKKDSNHVFNVCCTIINNVINDYSKGNMNTIDNNFFLDLSATLISSQTLVYLFKRNFLSEFQLNSFIDTFIGFMFISTYDINPFPLYHAISTQLILAVSGCIMKQIAINISKGECNSSQLSTILGYLSSNRVNAIKSTIIEKPLGISHNHIITILSYIPEMCISKDIWKGVSIDNSVIDLYIIQSSIIILQETTAVITSSNSLLDNFLLDLTQRNNTNLLSLIKYEEEILNIMKCVCLWLNFIITTSNSINKSNDPKIHQLGISFSSNSLINLWISNCKIIDLASIQIESLGFGMIDESNVLSSFSGTSSILKQSIEVICLLCEASCCEIFPGIKDNNNNNNNIDNNFSLTTNMVSLHVFPLLKRMLERTALFPLGSTYSMAKTLKNTNNVTDNYDDDEDEDINNSLFLLSLNSCINCIQSMSKYLFTTTDNNVHEIFVDLLSTINNSIIYHDQLTNNCGNIELFVKGKRIITNIVDIILPLTYSIMEGQIQLNSILPKNDENSIKLIQSYDKAIQTNIILSITSTTYIELPHKISLHWNKQDDDDFVQSRIHLRDIIRDMFEINPNYYSWLAHIAIEKISEFIRTMSETNNDNTYLGWSIIESYLHCCTSVSKGLSQVFKVDLNSFQLMEHFLNLISNDILNCCRPLSIMTSILISDLICPYYYTLKLNSNINNIMNQCCRSLLLSIFHTELSSNLMTSGTHIPGYFINFRTKQDHIGIVSIMKLVDIFPIPLDKKNNNNLIAISRLLISSNLFQSISSWNYNTEINNIIIDEVNKLIGNWSGLINSNENEIIEGDLLTNLLFTTIYSSIHTTSNKEIKNIVTWKSLRILICATSSSISRSCLYNYANHSNLDMSIIEVSQLFAPFFSALLSYFVNIDNSNIDNMDRFFIPCLAMSNNNDNDKYVPIYNDTLKICQSLGQILSKNNSLTDILNLCNDLVNEMWKYMINSNSNQGLIIIITLNDRLIIPIIEYIINNYINKGCLQTLYEFESFFDLLSIISIPCSNHKFDPNDELSKSIILAVGNSFQRLNYIVLLVSKSYLKWFPKAINAITNISNNLCTWRNLVDVSSIFSTLFQETSLIGFNNINNDQSSFVELKIQSLMISNYTDISNSSNNIIGLVHFWTSCLQYTDLFNHPTQSLLPQLSREVLGLTSIVSIVDTFTWLCISEGYFFTNTPATLNSSSNISQDQYHQIKLEFINLLNQIEINLNKKLLLLTNEIKSSTWKVLIKLLLLFTNSDINWMDIMIKNELIIKILKSCIISLIIFPTEFRDELINGIKDIYINYDLEYISALLFQIFSDPNIKLNGNLSNNDGIIKTIGQIKLSFENNDWKKFKNIFKVISKTK